MGVFKIITYISAAITVGLIAYLYKVMDQSGYLEQVASIPADDIMGYHILAAVVIAWLLFSLIMKTVSRGLVIGLLVLAVGAEGTFLGMNLSGKIVEQSELEELIRDKGQELLDEMKDKIGG